MATAIHSAVNGSHEETRELMSAYAEGELRGLRRWRVGRHVARCEICRAVYESFAAALDGVRALGRSEPPPRPDLADEVVKRIREGGRDPTAS